MSEQPGDSPAAEDEFTRRAALRGFVRLLAGALAPERAEEDGQPEEGR